MVFFSRPLWYACPQGLWTIFDQELDGLSARPEERLKLDVWWWFTLAPVISMCPARPRKQWDQICIGETPTTVMCMSKARALRGTEIRYAMANSSQPQLYTWVLRPITMLMCTRMVMDWKSFARLRISTGGGFRRSWGDFFFNSGVRWNCNIFWWTLNFGSFIYWFPYIEASLMPLRSSESTLVISGGIIPTYRYLVISPFFLWYHTISYLPPDIVWYHPLHLDITRYHVCPPISGTFPPMWYLSYTQLISVPISA